MDAPSIGCACSGDGEGGLRALRRPLDEEVLCMVPVRYQVPVPYRYVYQGIAMPLGTSVLLHTQRLSKAAACGNVDGIHKMIQAAKQSAAARARGAQERDA